MTTGIGFATQGELVQFIFESFGMMPRKGCLDDEFDEKSKKTLQKLISRLVKEEGLLQDNFTGAITTFDELLASYLPNNRVRDIMGTLLSDMFNSYNELIRTEGTFLPKDQTLLYFISMIAIPKFVILFQLQSLRYRTFDLDLTIPSDQDWFLPSVDSSDTISWPLKKAMDWIYKECGLSQAQFHYPTKLKQYENPHLTQNLENAYRWSQGKSLPSLTELLSNFNYSLNLVESDSKDSTPSYESIIPLLVIARLATSVGKKILSTYGRSELFSLADQCHDYLSYIQDDVDEFKSELKVHIEKKDYSVEAEIKWDIACVGWMKFLFNKFHEVSATIQRLEEASPDQSIKPMVKQALIQKYGKYAVLVNLDLHKRGRRNLWKPTQEFAHFLLTGLDLKKKASTTVEQIDKYTQELDSSDVKEQISWLEPWIRAVFYYRKEQYEKAYPYYEAAFSNARYKAGKYQYDLVNQYIEASAKLDKWQQFKKGVYWANYLNLSVRWIRDKELTEENLKMAYTVLKKATYTQL